MNTPTFSLPRLALLALCAFPLGAAAQDAEPVEKATPTSEQASHPARALAAQVATPAEPATPPAPAEAAEPAEPAESDPSGTPDDGGPAPQEIVSVGHDSKLAAGEKAAVVVSVFGSSTSEGEVSDGVVSILGDTRVSGPVGDAAVAVLGDLYLNSKIGGNAVAVMGNLELGPNAEVGGQTVVIGGTLKRADTAITHGGVEQVLGGHFGGMQWLRPWFKNCLLLGRPLALAPGLGWAWGLAFGFLALYVLLAFMFRGPVDRCVTTFEEQPGRTLLASLLALLLSPVMMILLVATVIGLALVPFVGAALFIAGMFGKIAVLALIGKRITRPFGNEMLSHPAIGVLIAGVLMLGLYMVPFIGFITYKLLGILGLGVVVYTLIVASRTANQEAAAKAPGSGSNAGGSGSTTYASSPGDAAAASAGGFSSTSAYADPASAAYAAGGPAAGPGNTPPPAAESIAPIDVATLPRAGFWVRMGALFIDVILIAVTVSLLDHLGGIWLLLLAIYGAVMWKLKGTTIGGIVFHLKVARLDGRPIDWSTAIVRALGCFLSLVLIGLGFLWILFDDERQAWHDKIAGTVVVRLPKGVPLV